MLFRTDRAKEPNRHWKDSAGSYNLGKGKYFLITNSRPFSLPYPECGFKTVKMVVLWCEAHNRTMIVIVLLPCFVDICSKYQRVQVEGIFKQFCFLMNPHLNWSGRFPMTEKSGISVAARPIKPIKSGLAKSPNIQQQCWTLEKTGCTIAASSYICRSLLKE